jgi:tRNA G18 (ribose-2'-O)-methylase SpoU
MGVIHIDHSGDPRVDDFRHLSTADRRPDRPGGRGLVIAEGTVVVSRLLASRYPVRALLGVQRRFAELAGTGPVAVLEGVGDHENLGALFRNAAALGVGGVLLGPGCSDPLYRRSVRVSMGHVLRVPFGHLTDWPGGLDDLRARGFAVAAFTPRPGAIPLRELREHAPGRVALLFGAEGPGLTETALAAADHAVRIPMPAGVDSLNIATAAAIAFYELARDG